ncbi:LAFA_0D13102g1_1 [Lachancea sp. 'fantastica']|nr:LAFA_0D13102g1_1 [Lachancea sp. 'fantastica']
MILQCLLAALAFFLQVSAAGTSFLAVNSQRYQNALSTDKVNSWEELSALSDTQEPLVCFRFTNFDLLTEMARFPTEVGFLSTFFEDLATQAWNEDSFTDVADASSIEVQEIPEPALPSLYSQVDRESDIIVFEFSGVSYDLKRLDEFLETVYVFLEEELMNIDNIVIQVPSVGKGYVKNTAKTSDIDVSDPDRKPVSSSPAGNGDELSSLWTEGLISCLIVTAILLAILFVAISWITSLEISYGAFEKPVNPLKKTN